MFSVTSAPVVSTTASVTTSALPTTTTTLGQVSTWHFVVFLTIRLLNSIKLSTQTVDQRLKLSDRPIMFKKSWRIFVKFYKAYHERIGVKNLKFTRSKVLLKYLFIADSVKNFKTVIWLIRFIHVGTRRLRINKLVWMILFGRFGWDYTIVASVYTKHQQNQLTVWSIGDMMKTILRVGSSSQRSRIRTLAH